MRRMGSGVPALQSLGWCRQLVDPIHPSRHRMVSHAVAPHATPGAYDASSQVTLRADSDLRAYRPCHWRDGTAGIPSPELRCYPSHRRASTLSVTTTGRPEQPEDGPRCRRCRGPRDSHESAVGRMEQLADVGRSDPALRGLNDHATTGSGPTRQSDARDSELPCVSRRGTCRVLPRLTVAFSYQKPAV